MDMVYFTYKSIQEVILITDEEQLQTFIYSTKIKLFVLAILDKRSGEKRIQLIRYLYILWQYRNELLGQKKLATNTFDSWD